MEVMPATSPVPVPWIVYLVPPVIPVPGGVIVASIDGGRGGGRPAGSSPVGSVHGDCAAYLVGRFGAIGGGRVVDRWGGHSMVATVEGDVFAYSAGRPVAIDRACGGGR